MMLKEVGMDKDTLTPLRIAEATRAYYIQHHQAASATTIAAVILFDNLIADLRNGHRYPVTFVTREQLTSRMTKHPDWGGRAMEKSIGDVADLVKTQLKKYRNKKITVDGMEWIASVYGPIAADRPHTADRPDLALEIEYRPERRLVDSTPRWPLLIGRCVCCTRETPFNADKRYCDWPECPSQEMVRHKQDRDLLVTIIPQRDADYSALRDETKNAFVHFLGDPLTSDVAPAEYLPYEQDHLAAMGLVLGKPLVYRCKRIENWSDFETVYVLDLAGYRTSNTLKDPKSWAVVNCAIDAEVSLLALYTAGNAGISLARLLYEASRLGERHFRLFSLIEHSLPAAIQMVLRSWDCTVVEAEETSRYLLEPKTMWKRIERFLEDEQSQHDRRWHVTDGWDGVGVTMYRLMFIEVLRRLKPDFVVLPVGTGSLFTGAYLALTDLYGPQYKTQLVGAVSLGENVTRPFSRPVRLRKASRPVAPKLVGRYSPLSRVLEHISKTKGGIFIEVSKDMQEAAGRALLEGARRDQLPIASEPSALVAPAALKGDGHYPGLWEELQAPNSETPFNESDACVLVVNSGLGLLGEQDVKFLAKLL